MRLLVAGLRGTSSFVEQCVEELALLVGEETFGRCRSVGRGDEEVVHYRQRVELPRQQTVKAVVAQGKLPVATFDA